MDRRNPYELYSIERYVEDADMEHHGMKGQRWGIRRYQNPDGSLTPLGQARLAKKQIRYMKKTEKAQNKARKEAVRAEKVAVKQQKRSAAEEEKRVKKEEEILKKKEKIFKSGSAEDMMKHKDLFSDAEIAAFVNRKRKEQELEQFLPKKEQKGKDKGKDKGGNQNQNQKGSTVDRIVSGVNKADSLFNAYKKGAGIVNALTGTETLPTFDNNKKGVSSLYELTADEIVKRQSQLTTDELADLSRRMSSLKVIGGSSSKADSGSKKSTDTSSTISSAGTEKITESSSPSSSPSYTKSKGSRHHGLGSRTSSESEPSYTPRYDAFDNSQLLSSKPSYTPRYDAFDNSQLLPKYDIYNDPSIPRHTGSSYSKWSDQVLRDVSSKSVSSASSSKYPEIGLKYTEPYLGLPMHDLPGLPYKG